MITKKDIACLDSFMSEIISSYEEFKNIDEPRGDLQAICEGRAMNLLRKYVSDFETNDYALVLEVSSLILQQIDNYKAIGWR